MLHRDSSPVVYYGGTDTESDSIGTPQTSRDASGCRSYGRDDSAVAKPMVQASTVKAVVGDNKSMTDIVACDIISTAKLRPFAKIFLVTPREPPV